MTVHKLLTRKQVASIFSVTTTTVRNWQVSGLIKTHCVINGRPRYSQENVTQVSNLKNETNHAK